MWPVATGDAVGGGFGADVHHVGLALGVEVGEGVLVAALGFRMSWSRALGALW